MLKTLSLLKNLATPAGLASLLFLALIFAALKLIPTDILIASDSAFPKALFIFQFICIFVLLFWLARDLWEFLKPLVWEDEPTSAPQARQMAQGSAGPRARPSAHSAANGPGLAKQPREKEKGQSWLKRVLGCFRGLRPHILAAAALALAAALLAGTQIEPANRNATEEGIWLAIGQNMRASNAAVACPQGIFQGEAFFCKDSRIFFNSKGLPFLEMLGIEVFGKSMWHWAFKVQLVLFPLTLLAFFLAVLAWTRSDALSLLAMALLAAQPALLFQTRSLSVEPLYILLLSLSLLTFRFAFERNTWAHWVLAALTLAFFAQVQTNSVFSFAAFALLAWPRLLDSKGAKLPLFIFSLALFTVPVLITNAVYWNYDFSEGAGFDVHGHFFENLLGNWRFMTHVDRAAGGLPGHPFLPYFNYLAALGLVVLLVATIRELALRLPKRATPLLACLALYSLQAYPILENLEANAAIPVNQHLLLPLFPALALLAAYPFCLLLGYIKHTLRLRDATALAIVLACVPLVFTLGFKRAFNSNLLYMADTRKFELGEIIKWADSEAGNRQPLFFYSFPVTLVAHGFSAMEYSGLLTLPSDSLARWFQQHSGAYYVRGLDCAVREGTQEPLIPNNQLAACRPLEQFANLDKVAETAAYGYKLEIFKIEGLKSWFFKKGELKWGVPYPDSLGKRRLDLVINREQSGDGNREQSDNLALTAGLGQSMVHAGPLQNGTVSLQVEPSTRGYELLLLQAFDKAKGQVVGHAFEWLAPSASSNTAKLGDFLRFGDSLNVTSLSELGGPKMTIGRESYGDYFGLATPYTGELALGGRYDSLSAIFGFNDSDTLCAATAMLRLQGDGATLYEGELEYGKSTPVNLNLAGIQHLTLEAVASEEAQTACTTVGVANALLYRKVEE